VASNDNEKIIYILDTNVLFRYLAGQVGFCADQADVNLQLRINSLFVNQEVVIPMAAMIEILGQFFNQNIDTGGYDFWYQQRKVVFDNCIINSIFDPNRKVSINREPVGMHAVDLAYAKFSDQTKKKLHEKYLWKRGNNKLYPREPKLYDGVDSLITAEAIDVAQKHSDRKCFLVSSDLWLKLAILGIQETARRGDARCPTNLYFKRLWDI